jgi:hypothetical protein
MRGRPQQPRNKPILNREPRQPSPPLDAPLLVRLLADYRKLPAGFVYELPRHAAELLLRQKVAHVVGTVGAQPDLVLDDSDWLQATTPDRRTESHCLHIHTDPTSPRCLIDGVHLCPLCSVDRVCALLAPEGLAGDTANRMSFRACPHMSWEGSHGFCKICFYAVLGAMEMMWGHTRSRNESSTTEANRLLRLIVMLSTRHGKPLGRMQAEQAILKTNWETREDYAAATT